MQDSCTLAFVVEPRSDDEPAISIVPVVNGVRLAGLIEEFERARMYEPSGGYAGLVPDHFNFGPLELTQVHRFQTNVGCLGVNVARQAVGH
jgi:hypothetical protein